MKKIIMLFFALSCVLALVGCSKIKEPATPTSNIEDTVSTETETQIQNEILQFFADKYNMKFTLWGPEGHDLYAFYIYPDHAERECLILMPANTDDVAECIKNLAWEVVGDELIITGGWQETFKIDITAETATSTATGKVYQIYEMQSELR
mgnify:FL=1